MIGSPPARCSHLRRNKSNSALLEWIRDHPASVRQVNGRSQSIVYRATEWRLKDRLTEADIVRLAMAYQTAMTTRALAERYGINVKSVRKLLREMECGEG